MKTLGYHNLPIKDVIRVLNHINKDIIIEILDSNEKYDISQLINIEECLDDLIIFMKNKITKKEIRGSLEGLFGGEPIDSNIYFVHKQLDLEVGDELKDILNELKERYKNF